MPIVSRPSDSMNGTLPSPKTRETSVDELVTIAN